MLRLAPHRPTVTGMPTDPPLFTGDDYQLLADAIYREEDRRHWFREETGAAAPEDDQLERLGDLARRMGEYLRRTGQAG